MTITQEQFDNWIKDLRSGEYKQGRGSLVAFNVFEERLGHCCLGVLAVGTLGGTAEEDVNGFACVSIPGHRSKTYRTSLPTPVLPSDIQDYLAGINDNRLDPKTFADIANLLEAKGLDWVNGTEEHDEEA